MASEALGGGLAATSVAGTVPTPASESIGACVQLTEFMPRSLVLGPCAGGAAWKVIAHLGALPEGRVGVLGTEAWTRTISALCFSLHFCSAKAVLSGGSSQPKRSGTLLKPGACRSPHSPAASQKPAGARRPPGQPPGVPALVAQG